ncbi:MAG TPA: ABC transporter ATP-binding protein [Nocardioidaceae bacterium]|nr:ABC transporter ATP-binding protein [Nocardioidaceae bacterium]
MSEIVLELIDVTKEYGGDPPTRALRGVSLAAEDGELTAIVGPSGSGKSTLLNIIGTLDRPTSGTVRVAGYDTRDMTDRQLSALRARELGFVFQQFFLLSRESAVENVADALLYRGLTATERRERAVDALQSVGLGHRLGHHPNQLSGGERQRVAIARALVGKPSLMLADEPTGNLDTRTGTEIMDLLGELNASGTTVVVITHEQEVAGRCRRRVAVRDGLIEHDSRRPAVLS